MWSNSPTRSVHIKVNDCVEISFALGVERQIFIHDAPN